MTCIHPMNCPDCLKENQAHIAFLRGVHQKLMETQQKVASLSKRLARELQ